MRADLLERYQALPLPTTKDEHWRFTDLEGFDPEAFTANGATSVERASGMLDVDAAAIAHVSEGGIEIERAPEGVVFEPLGEHELLGTLVGTDEKFAAHNAAEWKNGLLVRVPKGVELEKPLYVRIVNSVEGGALFWRLLVVAEEGSRFALHRGVRLRDARARRLLERRRRSSSSSRARSSSTSPSRASRPRRGTSPRTGRGSGATPSSTGSPAASARRRARCGSRTTSPAKARPRA